MNTAGRECPLFDMGNRRRHRVCLTLSAHTETQEELMDSRILLKGAYSADPKSVVRWIEERTPDQWSDGASLTTVLLLSLGLWGAVWQVIASLASAVLR